jgi:hypothetical protein
MHFERAVPFFVEVFTNQTPVAVMRRVFRTKEAHAVEYVRLEALLNLTFRHQSEKALFVCAPVALLFLVCP